VRPGDRAEPCDARVDVRDERVDVDAVCGRPVVVEVSARATRSGASRGYFDLIRAATPATSAQAGLVPLTSQYWPSLPSAGTFTPGAAIWTDRLSLENEAGLPDRPTAATPSTPG